MNTVVTRQKLSMTLHGFSGTIAGKQYAATGFKLMDKLWKVIRDNHIATEGKNIWLYEPGEKMFVGVEIGGVISPVTNKDLLETKHLVLEEYAYYKHIGPYQGIQQAGKQMISELTANGTPPGDVYIEIYGHWQQDESTLETELIMSLKHQ